MKKMLDENGSTGVPGYCGKRQLAHVTKGWVLDQPETVHHVNAYGEKTLVLRQIDFADWSVSPIISLFLYMCFDQHIAHFLCFWPLAACRSVPSAQTVWCASNERCAHFSGTTLQCDVTGKILMKCFLSGMPDLKLGLNDKIGLEKEAEAKARPSRRLVALHVWPLSREWNVQWKNYSVQA